jgi:hypothetical protein
MDHRDKQSISTLICALGLCAFSFSAQATEVKGVKIDETAKVGGQSLFLNGTGLRTKMMLKVYVAALYLEQKQNDANEIIIDHRNKRIAIHFLREISSEKLVHGMDEALIDNNSLEEMAAIESQLKSFRLMLTSAKVVKDGDVILLDFMPPSTQISFNDKLIGKIEGEMFDQALLRVWLGAHAIDASLKKALLDQ